MITEKEILKEIANEKIHENLPDSNSDIYKKFLLKQPKKKKKSKKPKRDTRLIQMREFEKVYGWNGDEEIYC